MVWYRYPHGPASFEMEWKILDGGFVELNFTNAFVDASGAVTPGLAGPRAVSSFWHDCHRCLDRYATSAHPARIGDQSVGRDHTWTAATERGRTEYRIEDGGLTVRGYVEADGEKRLFGETHYTRVNGGI